MHRRNRVWQADFSEFETGAEGTWRLGGILDYATKTVLGCAITATSTASDLIAVFDRSRSPDGSKLGQRVPTCEPGTGRRTPTA